MFLRFSVSMALQQNICYTFMYFSGLPCTLLLLFLCFQDHFSHFLSMYVPRHSGLTHISMATTNTQLFLFQKSSDNFGFSFLSRCKEQSRDKLLVLLSAPIKLFSTALPHPVSCHPISFQTFFLSRCRTLHLSWLNVIHFLFLQPSQVFLNGSSAHECKMQK